MLAIFLALTLAWAGLIVLFRNHAVEREVRVLVRHAERLVADVTIDTSGTPQVHSDQADPRFTEIAGGLYWQISAPKATLHSPSLWDQSLPAPTDAAPTRWTHRIIKGPFSDRLLVISRRVQIGTDGPILIIQLAEPDTDIAQSNIEFGLQLAISLFVLWVVLAIAAYVQVTLGLRPLVRLRSEMERLRKSPAARLTTRYPVEILPLITAINALAEAREGDLARARRRAADLAHSLKTPLAVLSAQSRKARTSGAVLAADGLDRAISVVGAALETELTRARSAAARAAIESVAQTNAATVVERVISVIERTDRGENIIFDTDVPPDLVLPVAAEDLAEMIGALTENAARHARRRVRLVSEPLGLRIEDDGPGVALERMERAVKRGQRLDEAGTGHGLGLSIVRDLIEATEGDIAFGHSDLGGLSVTLTWTPEA
ncbi:MAG: sensor histidine kinase [Asticcacaulis sp.]|uniref:sensor histidine kinase n=1 Tax=Asticcacaulis sp. TaxID=1872648 RepID=UPI0039E698B4